MIRVHGRFSPAPLMVVACALMLYLATMAPSITWQHDSYDAGDLITAAHTLGIPHPSGYPTYMLLGRLFTSLPFRDIAGRMNLLSAVSGAVAVGLACHTAFDVAGPAPGRWGIAAGSALLLATAPVYWSQSLVTEVYALNAAFHAALLCLGSRALRHSVRAQRSSSAILSPCLSAAALLFGLGLGNHLTLVFSAPLLAAPCFILWRQGAWRLSYALRLAAWFLLGLSVYAYLPIRAGAEPLFNWGNPQTLDGFVWMVTGGIYQQYVAALPLQHLGERMAAWLHLLRQQFGLLGVLLGVIGARDLFQRDRVGLAVLAVPMLALSAYAIAYNTTDSYVYLLPVDVSWTVMLAAGTRRIAQELSTARPNWSHLVPHLLAVGLLLLAVNAARVHWSAIDLSQDHTSRDYGTNVLRQVQDDAILISVTDHHTFTLWYFLRIVTPRPRVALVDADLLGYDWYVDGLRRTYPWLKWPAGGPLPSIQDFIQANLNHSQVYLTDPHETLLTQFVWDEKELLYQLRASQHSQ